MVRDRDWIMGMCYAKLEKVEFEPEKMHWEIGSAVARTLVNSFGIEFPRSSAATLLGIRVDINMFNPWCIKLWREVE